MNNSTSWQKVSSWYMKLVDKNGSYYHEHVVVPKTLALLNLTAGSSVLDLACGQGIMGRKVPGDVNYLGLDISRDMIKTARKMDQANLHRYLEYDVTMPLDKFGKFTRVMMVLALQNIREPEKVFENAASCLNPGGAFVIIISHPCFRIPRQSSWEIDPHNKIEYRRINRYLSPLEIPIRVHPGKENSPVVWSFHKSISDYSCMLRDAGFLIEVIDEWVSDKESTGKAAKMENRARLEFPLFMAIKAIKFS